MKRLTIIFLAAVLLSLPAAAFAQDVGAAEIALLLTGKLPTELAYYIDSVTQAIQSAQNTYNQFQNMLRQEQQFLENLKGLGDLSSFQDFMDFYDRQSNLVKQTVDQFKNIGVTIGGKTYKLEDLEKINDPDMQDAFAGEFSEQERRELWTQLGLSPANYVYMTAWQSKEQDLAQNILTRKQIINEEMVAAGERRRELLEMTNGENVQEKGLLQAILEVQLDTNLVTRQAAYDAAEARELELAQKRLENRPISYPPVSDSWDSEIFPSSEDE
jgi:hypothetical protein